MDQTTYEKLSPEQKWEKATIANNFIFYKVMHNNPDVCKELLEILLQIKIDHITMHTEETIEVDYGKKGVRLDVYAVGLGVVCLYRAYARQYLVDPAADDRIALK